MVSNGTIKTYPLQLIEEDAVTERVYGVSDNLLDREDWGPIYYNAYIAAGIIGLLLKHMFWVFPLVSSLPVRLQAALSPELALGLQLRKASSPSIKNNGRH